jgi:hypothetical protein
MPTVLVSGAIANKHLNGGEAWLQLSWLLGLQRLGCDVYFVEQIDAANCVDAKGTRTTFERSVNLEYFKAVMKEFGLRRSAALVYENGEQTSGLSYPELTDLAEATDLLINLAGHLSLEPIMRKLRRKAYVDLDPGFTQFWQAAGNLTVTGHDYHFTVGENIGTEGCPVPTDEISWRPTRHPVVLDEWPIAEEGDRSRFTTIATWRSGYGPVEYEGTTFGLKLHEFRKVIELPKLARQKFEIALDIHPGDAKDLDRLQANGWQIVDPKATVPDPGTFRRYVQGSGAEFSVAQGIYVDTQVGWFSDRTARYLASGKPVLVQDTGFSHNYPVGDGLVAFRTLEEAVDGAGRIVANYDAHSRAAREIAERYFDSDKVLAQFLADADISA